MKGKLIVLEGTDCSGKETQSNLLVEFLNKNGYRCKKYCFPNYNSPTGKIIAGAYLGKEGYMSPVFEEGATNVDMYVASLLFAMDRKYNIKDINQSLENGEIVVLDRYISSNMAHQGVKLQKEKRQEFFDFVDKLEYDLLKLPKPDLQIFLYMPLFASKQLKANRKEKPDQHEQDENYLKKSENVYLELAKKYNFFQINCTEDKSIKTIKQINNELCKIVLDYLNKNKK